MPEGFPTTHDDYRAEPVNAEPGNQEIDLANYGLGKYTGDEIVESDGYMGTVRQMIAECRHVVVQLEKAKAIGNTSFGESLVEMNLVPDQEAARLELAERARTAAEAARKTAEETTTTEKVADDVKKKFLNPFSGQNPLTA